MESSFWRIESCRSLRKLAEWDDEGMELAFEGVKCPIDAGHQRAGKRLINLNVVLPDAEVQDFVWTWYSECLIQDRTLELLRSSGFTGFEVKPVNARFSTSSQQPPKLWELVLTGWAGVAKPESGIQLNESKSCMVCGHLKYTGLRNPEEVIDRGKWDGDDFFMVWPMPTYVFVSERVISAIRAHHLTGVHIVPVAELKTTDGFSPGRLHYWMPENRARQIGEPLGIF
jgi:Protein of unknown function (Gmx_para_CXXCG)